MSASQPDEPDLDHLLDRVEELAELGDHQSALQLLETARAAFPPDARVETARGWSFENLGADHLGSAASAYKEALRLDPEILEAREGLGNVLFALGDIDAANRLFIEVVEQVDRSGGDDPTALELQGWCLYKLSQFDRAVEVFLGVLAESGSLVAVRFDLGLALLAKGEVGKAVTEYGAAIAQLQRVTAARRVGALMVALDDLDAGIKDRPSIRLNYATQEMRSRLVWELSEARASVTAEASAKPAPPSGDA